MKSAKDAESTSDTKTVKKTIVWYDTDEDASIDDEIRNTQVSGMKRHLETIDRKDDVVYLKNKKK